MLKCTTAANNLLKRVQNEAIDWAKVDKEWCKLFDGLVKKELSEASADEASTGTKETKKA